MRRWLVVVALAGIVWRVRKARAAAPPRIEAGFIVAGRPSGFIGDASGVTDELVASDFGAWAEGE